MRQSIWHWQLISNESGKGSAFIQPCALLYASGKKPWGGKDSLYLHSKVHGMRLKQKHRLGVTLLRLRPAFSAADSRPSDSILLSTFLRSSVRR